MSKVGKKHTTAVIHLDMDEIGAWALFAGLLSFVLLPIWVSWWNGWYSVMVWLVCTIVALRVWARQDRRKEQGHE